MGFINLLSYVSLNMDLYLVTRLKLHLNPMSSYWFLSN
jgi:hypothetical protein